MSSAQPVKAPACRLQPRAAGGNLMRSCSSFITAISLAIFALVGACVTRDSADPNTGLLELPLTQTGPHGEQFRLANATFDITGGGGFLQTVTSGTESVIALSMPPGIATIQLRDGWRLEQLAPSGIFQPVDALLGSFNPAALRVLANQPAIAEFDFLIRDASGTLEIRLGVVTQPRELAGGFIVNDASDGFAAYAHARLDFAIFFDLAQLDSVTLLDGTKQHVYTAGPAAMEYYNDTIGTLSGTVSKDQIGGFLQYTVAAKPDGTIELSGSMQGSASTLSFGPNTIDLPPAIGPDGFPVDEFFYDSVLPFTFTDVDPSGTMSGVLRMRHLVPAP
jgi:hypothetical protein